MGVSWRDPDWGHLHHPKCGRGGGGVGGEEEVGVVLIDSVKNIWASNKPGEHGHKTTNNVLMANASPNPQDRTHSV